MRGIFCLCLAVCIVYEAFMVPGPRRIGSSDYAVPRGPIRSRPPRDGRDRRGTRSAGGRSSRPGPPRSSPGPVGPDPTDTAPPVRRSSRGGPGHWPGWMDLAPGDPTLISVGRADQPDAHRTEAGSNARRTRSGWIGSESGWTARPTSEPRLDFSDDSSRRARFSARDDAIGRRPAQVGPGGF
jgi:hypothetical protein